MRRTLSGKGPSLAIGQRQVPANIPPPALLTSLPPVSKRPIRMTNKTTSTDLGRKTTTSTKQRRPRATHTAEDGAREHDMLKGARASRRIRNRHKDKVTIRVGAAASAWAPGTAAEREVLRKAKFAHDATSQRRTIKNGRLIVTKKSSGTHARKRTGRTAGSKSKDRL